MASPLSHLPRVALAHTPTPLVKPARLSAALGIDLWIKRDDATGGAEAGNKIRKLEWLLADALASGASTVITCGGLQSNHARATALAAASLGLASILYLRTAGHDGGPREPPNPPRRPPVAPGMPPARRSRATSCSTGSRAPRSASSRRSSTVTGTGSWPTPPARSPRRSPRARRT